VGLTSRNHQVAFENSGPAATVQSGLKQRTVEPSARFHAAMATSIGLPAIPVQVIFARFRFDPGRISVVAAMVPGDDRKVRLGSKQSRASRFRRSARTISNCGITRTCAGYFPVLRFSQNSIASAGPTRHSFEIRYPTSLPVRSHSRSVRAVTFQTAASSSVVRARSYVARR
jgi:hypothetical protein